MGMDAYAIDREGRKLAEIGDFPNIRLENDAQSRAFAAGVEALRGHVDGIDADFRLGGLGITANASAVNFLMWFSGALPNDHIYSADSVDYVSKSLKSIPVPAGLPPYVAEDKSAMLHATVFIQTCAALGLGIEISP